MKTINRLLLTGCFAWALSPIAVAKGDVEIDKEKDDEPLTMESAIIESSKIIKHEIKAARLGGDKKTEQEALVEFRDEVRLLQNRMARFVMTALDGMTLMHKHPFTVNRNLLISEDPDKYLIQVQNLHNDFRRINNSLIELEETKANLNVAQKALTSLVVLERTDSEARELRAKNERQRRTIEMKNRQIARLEKELEELKADNDADGAEQAKLD